VLVIFTTCKVILDGHTERPSSIMADTAAAAAFFANKKKKKKTFKFNANNIDAATIEKKIHVDAPALSTDNDIVIAVSSAVNASDPAAIDSNDAAEQWDDEALAATLLQKKTVAASNVELLDMKALDLKRSDQSDIQEKLRVEETKAKLAAAREGMEKEAQRLKEEKERKEQESSAAKPRFGAAAAGLTSSASGGKWLPPHMRPGGGSTSLSSRLGMGGPGSQKLDTEDENLFPDLAAADAILEKQKAQGPAYKVPKKTPVGGGATWGSKPEITSKKAEQPPSEPEHATKEAEPKSAESEESSAAAPVPVAEPQPVAKTATSVPTTGKAPIKPTKKKKKDLSTFKPSS